MRRLVTTIWTPQSASKRTDGPMLTSVPVKTGPVTVSIPSPVAPTVPVRRSGAGCPVVGVEYGIEAYFVPEGEGRAIETTEKSRLEIVAAVARSGDAAIKRLLLDGKMLYTEPLY